MRKVLSIIILILILCLGLPQAGFSEIPETDLSVLSLEELNELKTDITLPLLIRKEMFMLLALDGLLSPSPRMTAQEERSQLCAI